MRLFALEFTSWNLIQFISVHVLWMSLKCTGHVLQCHQNCWLCVVLAQPTITVPPPGELTAHHGDTVLISCEARGIPTPLIVWRLNFGHVADPPRVTYNTDQEEVGPGRPGVGRGQISIRQARAEDKGAYTCEAINSKGNVFAITDTILHVLRKNSAFLCHLQSIRSELRGLEGSVIVVNHDL